MTTPSNRGGARGSAALAFVSAALAFAALAGCNANGADDGAPQPQTARPQLGLVTSLPIYWSEAPSFKQALSPNTEAHWAKDVLERAYQLTPVDLITAEALEGLGRLAVIQPRGLTPGENVALDDWVQNGGRLLLVLDPMLTEHSEFAIGDARRPADVALVPPLLARWGLAMKYDEAQPQEPRTVAFAGSALPLHLAGTLSKTGDTGQAQCETQAGGAAASCSVGSGTALLIADAALFEHGQAASADTVSAILKSAFERAESDGRG